MPDENVLGMTAAADLTGAEHFYVEQSAGDAAATGDQVRLMAMRGNFAQCRLALTGGNLVLSPFNGNLITIDGKARAIPDAGVSLVPTGLTATTLYYIYAFMSGATMTLEASTTAHATQANTGLEIKSGDATRTLVGMARVVTGPAFADSLTQRFVRGYYNRLGRMLRNGFTAIRSTTSTTVVEVHTEIRCEFVCWADDRLHLAVNGAFSNDNAGGVAFAGAGIDAALNGQESIARMVGTTGVSIGCSFQRAGLESEGYHYATVWGQRFVPATTMSFASQTTLSVMIA